MSGESSISLRFAAARAQGRMAFMPFVAAGDPGLETTAALIRELSSRGVDLIEVGFPYSDPIADGPVIQAAYTRALGRGVRVAEIFETIRSVTAAEPQTAPLVAMVSFAIMLRWGIDRFLDDSLHSGFAGLIVPDLPGDEAADLAGAAHARGLDLVQLIAPTTPPERAERILAASSGFVYCISIAGTTGVRNELPPELKSQLTWLRDRTELPLAVGFGISRPDQIAALQGAADGVIVGSAIVRRLERLADDPSQRDAVIREIGDFAATMLRATDPDSAETV
ncbi:MAG: tryptophan synthase subunit alpha [Planctomycetes bacterium]|nr:tryptophan synthase subunit alpha [Planctomycetota bacterium]